MTPMICETCGAPLPERKRFEPFVRCPYCGTTHALDPKLRYVDVLADRETPVVQERVVNLEARSYIWYGWFDPRDVAYEPPEATAQKAKADLKRRFADELDKYWMLRVNDDPVEACRVVQARLRLLPFEKRGDST